jgi:hypothetical protein
VAEEQRRYSPAKLVAVYKEYINGDPIAKLASTSMIERANLTVRTHCKRLARLTLAFLEVAGKTSRPLCLAPRLLQLRKVPWNSALPSRNGMDRSGFG